MDADLLRRPDMKAGVVGVGRVGGAIAFALAREGDWDELVLVDAVKDLARAQAEDIRNGLRLSTQPVIRAGSLDDLSESEVVVLCAGQGRKPGMTRLDLLHANAGLVAELKGGTEFGPPGTTADLIAALVGPRPRVVPCSVVLQGEYGVQDVAIGVPAVVGTRRVLALEEWPLSNGERAAFDEAARDLKAFADDAAVLLQLAPTPLRKSP